VKSSSASLNSPMLDARGAELRRAAIGARRWQRRRHRPRTIGIERSVTIRFGFPDDAQALMRLAALDSRAAPSGPVLLCEVDGELWAALSLADGAAAADPFKPTATVIELLVARADQLRFAGAPGRSAWNRLRAAIPPR
jgi:hypothetical protein